MPKQGQKKVALFVKTCNNRVVTVYAYSGSDMILLIDNSDNIDIAYKHSNISELINSMRRVAKNNNFFIKSERHEGKTYAEIYVQGWSWRDANHWRKYGFIADKLG